MRSYAVSSGSTTRRRLLLAWTKLATSAGTADDSQIALRAWDGEEHPGGPWMKCKGAGIDLLNPAFCQMGRHARCWLPYRPQLCRGPKDRWMLGQGHFTFVDLESLELIRGPGPDAPNDSRRNR